MSKPRAAQAAVGIAFVAVLVAACEAISFPTTFVRTATGSGADVVSIDMSPDSVRLQAVGQSAQVVATPRDANGNAVPAAQISWSSSNTTVANVSGTGLVTAQGEGEAQITAQSGGAQRSARVSVAPAG